MELEDDTVSILLWYVRFCQAIRQYFFALSCLSDRSTTRVDQTFLRMGVRMQRRVHDLLVCFLLFRLGLGTIGQLLITTLGA